MNLGKILGFEIRLDFSWFFVFALVVASLMHGNFPTLFPVSAGEPGPVLAVIGALLLFGSVLAHELGHGVVGRRFGMEVEGITLFIFGGLARLKDEPRTPAIELWMTLAGPLTSAALAAVFLGLGHVGLAYGLPDAWVALGGYLVFANATIAVFNMIPAFPLDGGRILRAILWFARRDVVTATRWSSNVSRFFAFGLIGLGVFEVGSGNFGGVWAVFIGLFVLSAASAAYQHTWLRSRLEGVTVATLLGPDARPIPAGMTLNWVHDDYVANTHESAFMVMDGQEPVAILTAEDIAAVPPRQWPWTTALAAAQPLTDEDSIEDGTDAWQALTGMLRANARRVLVLHEGRIRGVLTRDRMLAWLKVSGD
jgi:Zn-dependent protease